MPMTSSKLSWIDSLALELEPDQLAAWARSLSPQETYDLTYSWRLQARGDQLLPGTPGSSNERADWMFWLLLAGRGFGKTKTGAETCREWALNPKERILIIGPTNDDVKSVMINGPSGLLSCYPPTERPAFEPSNHLIHFPSGAVGITRSGEEPERLRGPQFTKFWLDEPAACKYPQEVWDQIQFGFRLAGSNLRGVITGTPKPIALIRTLVADPDTVITRGSSDDNIANLDPKYIAKVLDPYRGTRLGRQEIDAEILDDVPGALWKRKQIDDLKIHKDPQTNDYPIQWNRIVRIVVAVDPTVSHDENSDEAGIVVAGMTASRHALVFSDRSGQQSTQEWAENAIEAYLYHRADCIVAEKNQGGDLVADAIRAAAERRGLNPLAIPIKLVWAKRGKKLRAEPVAQLYEQGRVHHVGSFPALEDQMCNWQPSSPEGSPDRLDALVYAVTELLVDNSPVELAMRFSDPYHIF